MEATVIDQMKTILQHGHYTVDAQCDGDIGDLIWADVDMHDTGSKHINLDELKDIESKLILTTGSKSENRQEVEKFLDVSLYYKLYAEMQIILPEFIFLFALLGSAQGFSYCTHSAGTSANRKCEILQLEGSYSMFSQ